MPTEFNFFYFERILYWYEIKAYLKKIFFLSLQKVILTRNHFVFLWLTRSWCFGVSLSCLLPQPLELIVFMASFAFSFHTLLCSLVCSVQKWIRDSRHFPLPETLSETVSSTPYTVFGLSRRIVVTPIRHVLSTFANIHAEHPPPHDEKNYA